MPDKLSWGRNWAARLVPADFSVGVSPLLTLGTIIVVVATVCSLQVLRVEGQSMEYTLHDGEIMLVLRTDGLMKPLRLGQLLIRPGRIVVFDDPFGRRRPLVKRVVAVGESRIKILDGTLLVNGRAQGDPPSLRREIRGSWGQFARNTDGVRVPHGAYFLLSDNRGFLSDSRVFGSVSYDRMMGIVIGSWRRRPREGKTATVGFE